MPLQPLEMWLILQVVLEALLILLMIVFLFKLRKRPPAGHAPEEYQAFMERFLSESEKLSQQFTENLKQKKEISLSLLLKLERKINEMNRLLEKAEKGLAQADLSRGPAMDEDKVNPAAPENRALVVRLAGQGKSVEEIARAAKLHRGEVELILDLEKQFTL